MCFSVPDTHNSPLLAHAVSPLFNANGCNGPEASPINACKRPQPFLRQASEGPEPVFDQAPHSVL